MSHSRLVRCALRVSVLLGLPAVPALASPLLVPAAENAEEVEGPYTRVTVTAEGHVAHDGSTVAPDAGGRLPALVPPLKAFREKAGDGTVLVAGDARADFRVVRWTLVSVNEAGLRHVAFLTGPETSPPRGLLVSQSVGQFDPLVQPAVQSALMPLTVHLSASGLVFLRSAEAMVALPRVDGALDVPRLHRLLDEDRRLHPSANFVIVNTDDGVPYFDMMRVLDLTRGEGYARTLLAGGPAGEPWELPEAPPLVGGVERASAVRLHPDGEAEVRGEDGALSLVHPDNVLHYEAHCDAARCDIVVRTTNRRLHLGARPRDPLDADALFGKPLYTYDGRLGFAEPVVDGVFSPLVPLPGEDAPLDGPPAGPVLLGSLDKALIDGVIKANMGEIQACYQSLLEREPKATGQTTMKFVIARDGTVSATAVKASTIADVPFQDCLRKVFHGLRYPEPKGGGIVIVSYPLVFSPA